MIPDNDEEIFFEVEEVVEDLMIPAEPWKESEEMIQFASDEEEPVTEVSQFELD